MSNPAQGYEAYMVPALFRPWAERLVGRAGPRQGERVLDVGCGTGIVAREVAALLGQKGSVAGMDANPHMLEVARAAAAREQVSIEWFEGRAERLPFPDGRFDLVLCQFALMFFADRPAALAEMRRVLTHTGRVAVGVWQGLDRHPFYRTLHEVIQRRAGVSALELIFSLGSRDEVEALLKSAGFGRIDIEPVSMTTRFPDPEAFLAGEIEVDTAAIPSMQHLDEGARRSLVAAISVEMKSPLAEITEGNHVVIPFHAHLATASA